MIKPFCEKDGSELLFFHLFKISIFEIDVFLRSNQAKY